MADELRWETVTVTVADGTTLSNAGAEFRNDASRPLTIRTILWDRSLNTAANDERDTAEISKSPVIASFTNNNVFFAYAVSLGISGGTTGSGADDVSTFASGGRNFGKGQLTLEPNESLFVNTSKTSGGSSFSSWQIGYHY